MSRLQWGGLVWGLFGIVFLLLELPAHWRLVPWPTLSSTTWDIEATWEPFGACLLAILFVLALHLRFDVSALPLVVISAGTAAGLALHFIR